MMKRSKEARWRAIFRAKKAEHPYAYTKVRAHVGEPYLCGGGPIHVPGHLLSRVGGFLG